MYTGENKLMGMIGALIGAALGVIVWCIIGSMGYVTAIGGLAIAAGAIYGYNILGKDISKFGVLFSVVLIIISVYVGVRMTYALSLKDVLSDEGYKMSLFEAFSNVEKFIELLGLKSKYNMVMAESYIFTAIGSCGFLYRIGKAAS